MGVKVKICGLTSVEEAGILIREGADFGGIVLFFPKSKRCCDMKTAGEIVRALKDAQIKTVAVTVSPSWQQTKEIEALDFDYLQIHGELKNEVLKNSRLPIIRAFNISNMEEKERLEKEEKITGWLFDAASPGEGKVFDWELLKEMKRDGRMFFLAGGLRPENIKQAVEQVKPDAVDVSTGVEYTEEERKKYKLRKDAAKIKQLIEKVKETAERTRDFPQK